ncbi:Asparagine synthase [Evansella caseinilytica]|uniref:asparagine synthase (glutamine-hydrolyzing) n=1 Tax=Evansella caseinilytica TaxID=1503961 RepID=A0A1H3HQ18_9BACI|nr:asparagine synthase C-terminal domain-containing protein [Evansella caseinilytica]SDY17577.1 Asparagine synthase [Evansella caseinilytica]
MKKIHLFISNPDTQIATIGQNVWMISGWNVLRMKRLLLKTARCSEVIIRRQLIEAGEDATIIHIRLANSCVETVWAFRSIFSQSEIYYASTANGELLICDSFRNMLSQIAVKDRAERSDSFADHLLFPYTYETPFAGINRLGKGESLQFSKKTNRIDRKVADTFAPASGTLAVEEGIKLVDQELQAAVEEISAGKNVVNLLSGGADSTLIHTYLPQGTPACSAGIDSPEFRFEIDYAKNAASLLGADQRLFMTKETEYLSNLEETVDALCFIPNTLQIPLFYLLFKQTADVRFVCGTLAGELLGSKTAEQAVLAAAKHERTDVERQVYEELMRPPDDINGYALARFVVSTDLQLIKQVIGKEYAEQRLRKRWQHVMKRVNWSGKADPLTKHLEAGSIIAFLCDDTLSNWRQLAYANGQTIYSPFVSSRLVQAAFSVAPQLRYAYGTATKPLIKKLLKSRLPQYDVTLPKGGSGLPRTRYCRSGPLKNIFQQYGIPPILDKSSEWILLEPAWETSHFVTAVATYAIWKERVATNPDIRMLPGTRQWKWEA